MSHLSSPSHTQRNGLNEPAAARASSPAPEDCSGLETWDDDLREELERLAAEHRHLLASVGARSSGEGDESQRLRAENAELRRRLAELEQGRRQQPATAAGWEEQQKEYEALLEEKSEVIRDLHHKIAELREAVAAGHASASGEDSDPDAEQDVLRLRRELEEQRRQLQEDEEALEQQMKQMELTMARERAQLARQRVELQRLHDELRHEMDQASRDTGLRERLMPLQRRQQDASGRRAVATMTEISIPEEEQPPAKEPKRQSSGVFRKLFGS